MKASEFDEKFDANDDMTDNLDLDKAKRHNLEQTQMKMDMPTWMVKSIDKEASRLLGVSRQDIIKFWLSERLTQGRA